jgi:putative ABC transport system permease protein
VNPRRLVQLAMRSILRTKARSLLTVLGVVIGVGSVVVMVAIGQGAREEVRARIDTLGTNLIIVTPAARAQSGVSQGAGTQMALSVDDAKLLARESQYLSAVTPVIFTRTNVVAGNLNWRSQMVGVDANYTEIRAWPMQYGRFFTADEARANRKVAVLGATVSTMLFEDGDPTGTIVRLRGVPFEVIGVLAPKGRTTDGNDQDDIVILPYTTLKTRLAGWQFVGQILGSSYTKDDVPAAMAETKSILREAHRLGPSDADDFEIRDQSQLAATAAGATDVMTTLLFAVASISLLVGGIGIMNIMLVSVTERTREIGIRRALGARRRDVLAQFLVESIVLSGLGGVIGALLGVLSSRILAWATGWTTVVSPWTIGLAMAFSFGVGVFFGWYPARRAAALDPIEALRQL